MEKTTNYKLFKPELGDRVSIGDINENMDILDEKLKDVETVKIDKSRILSTKEELEAVTEPGYLVDALVAAQLNSDNKYPDYANILTQITTRGASWIATQNCYLIGDIAQGSNEMGPVVYVDGVMVGKIYVGGGLSSDAVICIPLAKGNIVTTSSGSGIYTLKAYGLLA